MPHARWEFGLQGSLRIKCEGVLLLLNFLTTVSYLVLVLLNQYIVKETVLIPWNICIEPTPLYSYSPLFCSLFMCVLHPYITAGFVISVVVQQTLVIRNSKM